MRDTYIIAGLSLFLLVLHEVPYRQTGAVDYPLFGLVSHAGSDLILMGTALTLATAVIERQRRFASDTTSRVRSHAVPRPGSAEREPLGAELYTK